MGQCNHNCAACAGCASSLELTAGEVEFLLELGRYSFLPVARRADDMTPVYLEDEKHSREDYSMILQCLEKKGLVDLDYRAPLGGFGYAAYAGLPVRGTVALTARGQKAVELLEIQGIG